MTETDGTVTRAIKQRWLKVNTKPIRKHALDGAAFPYIIQVQYQVNGIVYTRHKWIPAGQTVPAPGNTVSVLYDEKRPSKAKIF